MVQPGPAQGGKTVTGERRLPGGIGRGQAVEKALGGDPQTGFLQQRHRRQGARLDRAGVGCRDQIGADADAQNRRGAAKALAFQQDPGDLAAVAQHVVRPFQAKAGGQAGQRDQRVAQRRRRSEAAQRHNLGRARRLYDQGAVKVAGRAGPGPRPAPPPGGLPVSGDPGRPGQGRGPAEAFGVGAVDLGQSDVPGRAVSAQGLRRPGPRALRFRKG